MQHAARPATSPAGRIRALSASTRRSGIAPTSVATMGVPLSMASRMTFGIPSFFAVCSSRLAARMSTLMSVRGPRKRMRPASPSSPTCERSSSSSGPTPAMRKRTSASDLRNARANPDKIVGALFHVEPENPQHDRGALRNLQFAPQRQRLLVCRQRKQRCVDGVRDRRDRGRGDIEPACIVFIGCAEISRQSNPSRPD